MKPRLLDLFCGAGGAAMGYHRAGFDVLHEVDDEAQRAACCVGGCKCGHEYDRDEYDSEGHCTWCGGEGIWEGSRFGDPGWYGEDKFYDCPSCGGSGMRVDMTLW